MPCIRLHLRRMFVAAARWRQSPALPILEVCYRIVDERIAQRVGQFLICFTLIFFQEKDAQEGIEPGEPADFVDLFLDARAEETVADTSEFSKNNIRVRAIASCSHVSFRSPVLSQGKKLLASASSSSLPDLTQLRMLWPILLGFSQSTQRSNRKLSKKSRSTADQR